MEMLVALPTLEIVLFLFACKAPNLAELCCYNFFYFIIIFLFFLVNFVPVTFPSVDVLALLSGTLNNMMSSTRLGKLIN